MRSWIACFYITNHINLEDLMFSAGDSTTSVTVRYLFEENTILKVHIASDWETMSLGEIVELVPNGMPYFWRQ